MGQMTPVTINSETEMMVKATLTDPISYFITIPSRSSMPFVDPII